MADELSGQNDPATSSSGAERKRELERRRRETLYGRFRELERVVAETKPLPSLRAVATAADPPLNTRRWDKEAVLVDAILHIRRQAARLEALQQQNDAIGDEVEEAKKEKDELRKDKMFLRSELETSRNDCSKLRADNLNLWRACREAPGLSLNTAPAQPDVQTLFQGAPEMKRVPLESNEHTPHLLPNVDFSRTQRSERPDLPSQATETEPEPALGVPGGGTPGPSGTTGPGMAVLTDAETGKELALMSTNELAEIFGESVHNIGPHGGTLLSDFLVSMRDNPGSGEGNGPGS